MKKKHPNLKAKGTSSMEAWRNVLKKMKEIDDELAVVLNHKDACRVEMNKLVSPLIKENLLLQEKTWIARVYGGNIYLEGRCSDHPQLTKLLQQTDHFVCFDNLKISLDQNDGDVRITFEGIGHDLNSTGPSDSIIKYDIPVDVRLLIEEHTNLSEKTKNLNNLILSVM